MHLLRGRLFFRIFICEIIEQQRQQQQQHQQKKCIVVVVNEAKLSEAVGVGRILYIFISITFSQNSGDWTEAKMVGTLIDGHNYALLSAPHAYLT